MNIDFAFYSLLMLPLILIFPVRWMGTRDSRNARGIAVCGLSIQLFIIIYLLWTLSGTGSNSQYIIRILSGFLKTASIRAMLTFFIDPLACLFAAISIFSVLAILIITCQSGTQDRSTYFTWSFVLCFFLQLFFFSGSLIICLAGWMGLTVWLASVLMPSVNPEESARYSKTALIVFILSDMCLAITILLLHRMVGNLDYHTIHSFTKLILSRAHSMPWTIPALIVLSAGLKMSVFPFLQGLRSAMGLNLPNRMIFYTITLPAGGFLLLRNYVFMKHFYWMPCLLGIMTLGFAAGILFLTLSIRRALSLLALVNIGQFLTLFGLGLYPLIFSSWIIGTISMLILVIAGGILMLKDEFIGQENDEIDKDSRLSLGKAVRIPLRDWPVWLGLFSMAGIPPFSLFIIWQNGAFTSRIISSFLLRICLSVVFNGILVITVSRFFYILSCNIPQTPNRTFYFTSTPASRFVLTITGMLVLVFTALTYGLVLNSGHVTSDWFQPVLLGSAWNHPFSSPAFVTHLIIISCLMLVFILFLFIKSRRPQQRSIRAGWLRWAANHLFWVDIFINRLTRPIVSLSGILWTFDSRIVHRGAEPVHWFFRNWSQMTASFDRFLNCRLPGFFSEKMLPIVQNLLIRLEEKTGIKAMIIALVLIILLALIALLGYPVS